MIFILPFSISAIVLSILFGCFFHFFEKNCYGGEANYCYFGYIVTIILITLISFVISLLFSIIWYITRKKKDRKDMVNTDNQNSRVKL